MKMALIFQYNDKMIVYPNIAHKVHKVKDKREKQSTKKNQIQVKYRVMKILNSMI